MSRHTKNDGKTPDERLTPDCYDEHRPILAAPAQAVGGYYRGELAFDEYADIYKNHLWENVAEVIELIYKAKKETITVLCIEDAPELCHRRLLLEFSKELADIVGRPLETHIA